MSLAPKPSLIQQYQSPKSQRRRNWSLFYVHRIPTLDGNSKYLTRLRIVQTPFFGVYIHVIYREDAERHLHDHPWNFTSVVLRGGYSEEFTSNVYDAIDFQRKESYRFLQLLGDSTHCYKAGSIHRMRRGQFHAIRRLFRHPTWTLIFVGRRYPDWGFATEGGWVEHTEYLKRVWG